MKEELAEIAHLSRLEEYVSLVEILRWRAIHQPDQHAYTFLLDGELEEERWTYAMLDQGARSIASKLQQFGLTGERALLLYPAGIEFVTAFFGCLYAGVVAVPVNPPASNRLLPRIEAIADDAQVAVVLTTYEMFSRLQRAATLVPDLSRLHMLPTDQDFDGEAEIWQEPQLTVDTLAFLQYTSGSTGSPKGVMVSHGNLIHNSTIICQRAQHTSKSVIVSWLPLFHDLGLIAGVLQPVFAGCSAILMAPIDFLQRPVRWLQAISRYRGTTSYAPNFAYDLCVQRITDEDCAALDLSSWLVAASGAEIVRVETGERFAATFAPCGFRREALAVGYGMAENTLTIACSSVNSGLIVGSFDKTHLQRNQVKRVPVDHEVVQKLIGYPASEMIDQHIVVVDPVEFRPCTSNQIGEIWVAGPSVAKGYWKQPEETKKIFRAQLAGNMQEFFLRTGDLGFLQGGDLFVTGRLKDLIIIRGRNFYPQDIEHTIEQSHALLRANGSAAFSIDLDNEERLVVVQEVLRNNATSQEIEEAFVALRRAVVEQYEIPVYAIVFIRYGTLLKTSSGKIQHTACRMAFLAHELPIVAQSLLEEASIFQTEHLSALISRATLLAADTHERQTLLAALVLERIAYVLRVDPLQLHPDTPLSAFGLDSLKAAHVKNLLDVDLEMNIAFVSFLSDMNSNELAAVILEQLTDAPSSDHLPLVRVNENCTEYPLSLAQEQIWFINQLEPESSLYNISCSLRLNGRLSLPILEKSVNAFVARHEIFRTKFVMRNDVLMQCVSPAVPLPFPIISLEEYPLQEREREALRQAKLEFQQPFDLAHDSLIRVELLQLGKEQHILLLTIHHIIFDRWSVDVLIKELSVLYNAFLKDESAVLPALPVQYGDWANWQWQWMQEEEMKMQLAYWKRQLHDLPVLELPTDRSRPAVQTYKGSIQHFQLPLALSRELKELSRREGATLFMTLLAAFQILLARYTGQSDIAVGIPVANRTRSEIQELMGFFVNMLVIRTDCSGQPGFQEVLKKVRETCLAAYAHQDLPFKYVVEKLQPERDLSRNPLFQVLFTLQYTSPEILQLPDLTLSPFGVDSTTSKVDLTFDLVDSKSGLSGTVEYSSDLFDVETIKRMLGHYQRLLEDIVANPQQDILHLALLNACEQQQVLVEWNETGREYPQERCLHDLFEMQAQRTPEVVAVVYEELQLTYAALNRRANQLAKRLQAEGVSPDVLVGLCVERSVEMIIGMLGILKAGGAYVPLDPTYPKERLAFMLEDMQASVLVCQPAFLSLLPVREGQRVIDIDSVRETQASRPHPLKSASAQNLAYVIYTSGSTGKPKGVCISHQAVTRLVCNTDYVQVSAIDVVAQASNASFDAATFEIWGALLHGARLVGISKDSVLSAPTFAAHIATQYISTLFLTTALFNRMAIEAPQAFSTVRHILFGGEAVDPQWVYRILYQGAPERLLHVYGPTESTTFATWLLVENVPEGVTTLPIGKPVANTTAYVLDTQGQLVPCGITGELYLGGDGLSRGYLNQAALTAEKFVPHPWSKRPGERLYRTGDLVRYRDNGSIEFFSRIDTQVKVRGFRIELGEIEAVLLSHALVQSCVVIVREEEPGNKRLVAYVVQKEDRQRILSSGSLRSFLKETLPDYMLPSHIIIMETLPLTANGKVDRHALPAPGARIDENNREITVPRDAIEEILVEIWESVLARTQVGIHDNFFELGGHSMLVTQVISRIRQLFQVEIPLSVLFAFPTIAQLAQRIAQSLQNLPDQEILPLIPISREQPLLLSFAQQRLWFLDQLEPENNTYNIPLLLRLQGPFSVQALERSLREIIQRHESLRTTFHIQVGEAVQIIHPYSTFALSFEDVSVIDAALQEEIAYRLASQEAERPFNLTQMSLIRATLFKLSATEHLLLLNMHHIVADGWSMKILLQELSSLYRSFLQKQPVQLPDLLLQYADFAQWQRNSFQQTEVQERHLDYWQHQLAGLSPLELPTDRPRLAMQTFRGARQSFALPSTLYQQLKVLSRQEDVTLFMTLLAAFQVLLSRYSGQTDIAVGTPIANRTREEIEGLIGFFVNTLVLRSDLSGTLTFCDVLERVREVTLGAYTHQDLPFDKLVECLQLGRDLSRNPLFQVLFTLQQVSLEVIDLPEVTVSRVEIDTWTAKFDLTLELLEDQHGLSGTVEYSSDLFDVATIERMIQQYQRLLEGIVADPRQDIAYLPLLSAAEQQRLLVEWNGTSHQYVQECCLHQLFEAQVEQTPEAIAVVYEEIQLTYTELNRQSNQLAHYLRTRGVDVATLVGLCVERSLDLIKGILGILKAGGAYVPIDAQAPAERIEFILNDAQVQLVLTQQLLAEQFSAVRDIVCLDTLWPGLAQQPDQNPICAVQIQHLAYVIYTSGSTGKPKGVLVSHYNVARLFAATQQEFHFEASDVWTLFHSYAFDFSVWELWGALLHSARLVVVPYLSSRTPDIFYHLLLEQGVTVLNQTPTAFRQLMHVDESYSQSALFALRLVIFGGEALDIAHLRPWFARYGDEHPALVNMYGITETTVHVTSRWLTQEDAEEATGSSIGRPLADLQVYLLDESQQLVPIGIPGEIYVGGAGLAHGYLGRPELTSERFVVHPFSQEPGARLYRTGDRARYLHDGCLEYLGRLDYQVKVRGFRIELGEIEAVLSQHTAVSDNVVVVREDIPDNQRIVAYVVPKWTSQQEALSTAQLRSYLQGKLPEYMLPAAFIFLDALPLTPNGKLDYRALPVQDWVRSAMDEAFIAPQLPIESQLVAIWEDVLHVKQVGICDNFFALGGDSILCIQMIARASQVGLHITPKQLFQYQTIEELSTVITSSPFVVAEQGPVIGALPLTPIQHWFFAQQLSEPQHWNQSVMIELQPGVNDLLLEKALQACVMHHDALRLRFEQRETGWIQYTAETGDFVSLEHIEIAPVSVDEQALQVIEAALQASLNLSVGPLVRAAFIDCGDQKPSFLLIVIHHLVVDGVSWRIFVEDLALSYQQLSRGEDPKLAAKTIPFKRWSEKLVEYAQLAVAQEEMSYWLDRPAGRVFPLPVDLVERDNRESAVASVFTSLNVQETRMLLGDVPIAYRTQINDVLLTALAKTLATYSNTTAVLIDLEGHGREDLFPDIQVSRTVGWFTSLFPVFLDLDGSVTIIDALMAVKEQLRRIPQRGIGYGILRYLCEDARCAQRLQALPQAEVLFNYLGQLDQGQASSALFLSVQPSAGPYCSPHGTRTHLLDITCQVSGGQLQIAWKYGTRLHRRSTIERLARTFVEILREIIAHCQSVQATAYTPADFPKVRLNQEQLEQIFAEIEID